MKNAFIIGITATSLSLFSCKQEPAIMSNTPIPKIEVTDNTTNTSTTATASKIQLAILLDTSSSMNGLIEQAKNQLWKIVNQLAKAKNANNEDPNIEIALYQYGNNGLSALNDYIEIQSGFTGELDEISEKLFNLTTNGGEEYCGSIIQTSLNELQWSNQPNDLQLIFIAGNEAFNQGNISYQKAITKAINNNVIVNTIFCGSHDLGVSGYWKDAAILGKGKYMNIDQDAKSVHIDSPYDQKILQLNTQLNNTYIPYGQNGRSKKEKQINQDINANSYGMSNAVKRTLSKSSKVYKNSKWDLVDAVKEKEVAINKVNKAHLPEEIKDFTDAELQDYVTQKTNERDSIKKSLGDLKKKRTDFVNQEKQKRNATQNLDDAIINAITQQAQNKGYSFTE